jgi:WXXGXW repeat (2 copies)
MKTVSRLGICAAVAVAGVLLVAGSGSQNPLIPVSAVALAQDQPAQAPPDQGPDPAAVNQAPVQDTPSGPSYTTQAPPPAGQAGPQGQGPDDSGYAEQPTETANEAPPPLPDYDQPPPPDDGYIWTPGYWAWGPGGYYWVPGAWVEPPYMGALWTPGYWGFYGGRYLFYPGYWGLHIGFYGGINYGFGYLGFGYEGGYWNGGHFFYNRVYNHIDERVIHNVYNYRANVRVGNAGRASYRGGPGGVNANPRANERQAYREPTAPRMNTQVVHAQSFGQVHSQYASENHGHPPTASVPHGIPAEHGVQPSVRNGGGRSSGGGRR